MSRGTGGRGGGGAGTREDGGETSKCKGPEAGVGPGTVKEQQGAQSHGGWTKEA